MSPKPIRIILVDDHKLIRESIGLLLGNDKRFLVIKECENGQDAIESADHLKPDVMLVDINMHPVNGFEVAEKVLAADSSIKIICLSINNQAFYVNKMMQLGVRGYVTKGTAYNELTNAIIEVNNGQKYLSADVRELVK